MKNAKPIESDLFHIDALEDVLENVRSSAPVPVFVLTGAAHALYERALVEAGVNPFKAILASSVRESDPSMPRNLETLVGLAWTGCLDYRASRSPASRLAITDKLVTVTHAITDRLVELRLPALISCDACETELVTPCGDMESVGVGDFWGESVCHSCAAQHDRRPS